MVPSLRSHGVSLLFVVLLVANILRTTSLFSPEIRIPLRGRLIPFSPLR